MTYHHLYCDDSRSDAVQDVPIPQQAKVADDDEQSEKNSIELEIFDGQRESEREGQDGQRDHRQIDAVPTPFRDVNLERERIEFYFDLLVHVPNSLVEFGVR